MAQSNPAAASAIGGQGPSSPACIVHVSDIHVGWDFQQARWDKLVEAVKDAGPPDLIVVSGDLVNSPWRWQVCKVRDLLNQFAKAVSRGAEACPLWVVAGNHDTRLSGVMPVPWLLPIALGCLFLALGTGWLSLNVSGSVPPLVWTIVAVALALAGLTAIGLRIALVPNLAAELGGPMHLEAARLSPCGRIGVLPIDSASHDVSWARGKVTDRAITALSPQLKAVHDGLSGEAPRPVWIALVHHHPLPLPYDSSREHMMVMDNAGAVINELTRAEVRLVLHGHKHHQHFARIVINPTVSPYADLAVLAAGTPSKGRTTDKFRHAFNVIRLDAEGQIEIQQFQGPTEPGSFVGDPPFAMVPREHHEHERHRTNAKSAALQCRRLLCAANINAYGDARYVREYRGVSAVSGAVDQIPDRFVAESSSGLVESFVARSLSDQGPEVRASAARISPHRIEADIAFDPPLAPAAGAIDCGSEFHVSNAFALNAWQFECMYAGRENRTESLRCLTPRGLAAQELLMYVRFPRESGVPNRFGLRVRTPRAGVSEWHSLDAAGVVKIESQRVAQVRIAYPVTGAVYELNWSVLPLTDLPDQTGAGQHPPCRTDAITLALHLRAQLVRRNGSEVAVLPQSLNALLERIEQQARVELGAGAQQQQAYGIALFGFDPEDRRLRYLAGNYAKTDPRLGASYAYGMGTVGRAFKSAAITAFRRPAHPPHEQPWGYVMPNGQPVTQAGQVPEMAILAIPLAHPDAKDWPYAVLQISTDDPGCPLKTTNTPSDVSVERFAAAVCALTRDLPTILS